MTTLALPIQPLAVGVAVLAVPAVAVAARRCCRHRRRLRRRRRRRRFRRRRQIVIVVGSIETGSEMWGANFSDATACTAMLDANNW